MPWPGSIEDAELFNHCGGMLNHNKGWDTIQVAGSYGEPVIFIGKTILVKEVHDFLSLNGKLGLVIDTLNARHAGVVEALNEHTLKIINNNPASFHRDQLKKVYMIHWIRKI